MKVHRRGGETVIAACDQDLLDKKFSEGELRLEIRREFYHEKIVEREELMEEIGECTTANLVGEKTVSTYCSVNPEDKPAVKRIGGVPHIQIYRI
jgi:hypothetical protein